MEFGFKYSPALKIKQSNLHSIKLRNFNETFPGVFPVSAPFNSTKLQSRLPSG